MIQSYLAGVSAIVSKEIHLLLLQGIVLINLFANVNEFEQFIVKFSDSLFIYSIKFVVSEEHVPLFNKLSHSSVHNI